MVSDAWVALSLVPALGGRTLQALLDHYDDDLDAILRAPASELMTVRGIGAKIASDISAIDLDAVHKMRHQWRQAGVSLHDWHAPTYPPALRDCDDAPPLLFTRGDWRVFPPGRACAILGTRQLSPLAQEYAENLGFTCVGLGMTVVGGLALGVDTCGHVGALAMPQGRTVAVLGGGVLSIYPPRNQSLAQAIMQRGALVSENAPHAGAIAGRLVARNRLITGLVDVVFIVETSVRGGAMHAARFAQRQGRRLYTFDLPATGNQALIAQGVTVVAPELLTDIDALGAFLQSG